MRYALIADIHGNLPALEAVLSDAKKAKVDQFIFIGDYYMCLPYPNQVIDILKSNPKSYLVRGNEEDRIEMLSTRDSNTWTDGQFQALYWYYNEITDENRKYLISLQRNIIIDNFIHIAHKSSDFIGDVEMKKRISASRLAEKFQDRTPYIEKISNAIVDNIKADSGFKQALNKLNYGVYIFGHSHIQWHMEYANKYFINPGSCGFPTDFRGGAPYTILDISDGIVSVEERRPEYDEEKCVSDLLNSSLYKHEKVWNEIIIKEFEKHHDFLMSFLSFVERYAVSIGDKERPYSKRIWNEAYVKWSLK